MITPRHRCLRRHVFTAMPCIGLRLRVLKVQAPARLQRRAYDDGMRPLRVAEMRLFVFPPHVVGNELTISQHAGHSASSRVLAMPRECPVERVGSESGAWSAWKLTQ
ncbi:unnamed protein product, partial [Prorocentrum cordatum]